MTSKFETGKTYRAHHNRDLGLLCDKVVYTVERRTAKTAWVTGHALDPSTHSASFCVPSRISRLTLGADVVEVCFADSLAISSDFIVEEGEINIEETKEV